MAQFANVGKYTSARKYQLPIAVNYGNAQQWIMSIVPQE